MSRRARRQLRAVVLSGAGKAFCAGADAAWMAQTVSLFRRREPPRRAGPGAACSARINSLPVPVIGRVHGAAMGGGAGLAAVCDIVVAEEDAVFGFTEVKLGLIPAVDLVLRAAEDRPVGRARAVPDRRALPSRARVRDRPGSRGRARGGSRRNGRRGTWPNWRRAGRRRSLRPRV